MAYVFRGGIYFSDNKILQKAKTERIPSPKHLKIPMLQSSSEPAEVNVIVGAHVLKGDVIGLPANDDAIPIHSPVSGTVTDIGELTMPNGKSCAFVGIENDMQHTLSPSIKKCEKRLADCETDEIIATVRDSGICEPDGTPSHLILRECFGNAEYCIINCVFDEPYANGDYRVVLENPSAVVNGLKIILKALKLRRGIIAVSDSKGELLKKLTVLTRKDKLVSVVPVRGKYPASGLRELVYAVMGVEIGEGKMPIDVGAAIFSSSSAENIFSAFASGVPYISRAVTVCGDAVAEPKTVTAPIGTPLSELVDFAGGLKAEPNRIALNSVMTGIKLDNFDSVVTKTMTSLLILTDKEADRYSEPPTCIRCGKCASVCPMRLVPCTLYKLVLDGKCEKAAKKGALLCEECGACDYVCPGKVPLTDYIRRAKSESARLQNDEARETEVTNE